MKAHGTEIAATTYEVVAVEGNEFVIAIDDGKTLAVPMYKVEKETLEEGETPYAKETTYKWGPVKYTIRTLYTAPLDD